MKKYVCSICGYVYQGSDAPQYCPQCEAASSFVEQDDDAPLGFATLHHIGEGQVDDKEMVADLRENFTRECVEVGMYLAMCRQADREGYPEVAEAYRRIAFEEADHAARLAELLGDVIVPSTKMNLQVRFDAEAGACAAQFDIAKKAKLLGYDAIHDTMHDMAKDEARHGAIFAGLIKLYFG